MKTQILFTLFLLTASVCSAQQFVAYTAAETSTKRMNKETTTSSAALAQVHGEAAKNHLVTYLSEHLVYPTQLETIGLSGKLTLRVELNKYGKVKEVSVKDSELPVQFADAALEAFDGIKKVDFGPGKYTGSQVVYVPIQFSL